jgi:hypothetical protein
MARVGRPINWGSTPTDGIAIKGLKDIENDIVALDSFLYDPGDQARQAIVRGLLQTGETYARSLIGAGDDVVITTSTAGEKSKHYGMGVIKATGNDILFWEFGTGIMPWTAHPLAEEYGVAPASFSATHAQWLVGEKRQKFKGQWPYGGSWTTGQPPRKAMWDAAKAMREAIPSVAAQVTVFKR